MDNLDSRLLRYTDTFVKRFSEPGHVEYRFGLGGPIAISQDRKPFTIDVKPPKQNKEKNKQHNLVVRREGGRLIANPMNLEIVVGDMVLWHTPDSQIPGFAIQGRMKGKTFESATLRDEMIFSHAFGLPGEYHWVDGYGGNLSGVIYVEMVQGTSDKASLRWQKALREGTLIHIRGTSVEPKEVKILVGQTVFWVVEESDGICIADARIAKQFHK